MSGRRGAIALVAGCLLQEQAFSSSIAKKSRKLTATGPETGFVPFGVCTDL